MKIFSPLNETCDIEKLAPYANEFYLGVLDEEWMHYQGTLGKEYNTRGRNRLSNFSGWHTLEKAVLTAHHFAIPCYLTINAHHMDSSGTKLIRKIIDRFQNIGGEGIICSGLDTMVYGKKKNLKIIVSTILGLYNAEAIKYIADSYHPQRIVLSRDMRYDSICAIREQLPDIELETFGAFFGCRFSNAFCFCTHEHSTGGMCRTSSISDWQFKKRTPLSVEKTFEIEKNHWLYSNYLLEGACAICSFYRFIRIGIDSIKIVGRELPGEKIQRANEELYHYVQKAQKAASEKEYFQSIQKDNVCTTHLRCWNGYQCYYPECANKDFW